MNVDSWKCVVGWRAGKHKLNKFDDRTGLDIKKGKHSRTYIISFGKVFFLICKKAWVPKCLGKCYQVRRMRR